MAPIAICAVLKAKPGGVTALRAALEQVLPPSRAEAGNIIYTLHESLDEPDTFVFYETWADEEALKAHIESEHYKAYQEERAAELLESRHVYRLKVYGA